MVEAGHDAGAGLEEIQDAILDRLHAGERVDRPAMLAAHPRHAAALERFFELVDVIEAPPEHGGTAPARLGEFEILREIGRGGMGVVYAARQPSLNRSVALKVLPPALRRDARLHARFRREAEAAGRLRHPNIVPVYSIGESAGAPFFTMELVDGRSLADVLRLRRAGDDAGLPPAGEPWRKWCLQTIAKVGDALAYAHGSGILHRDVKPGNILLEQDGTPRLTDFGLALDLQASELTQTGEVFGSPLYMSPEQAFRHEAPVDARTDVYSLAVTLYELLTLRLPYAGSTQADLLAALSDGRIVAPRDADPELSEPVERVLLRALRRDPHERYANGADFVADLRLLLENPAAVRAPRMPSRGREPSVFFEATGPRGTVQASLPLSGGDAFHPGFIVLAALATFGIAILLRTGLGVALLAALVALVFTALLRGILVRHREAHPRPPRGPGWSARHPILSRVVLSLLLTLLVLPIALLLQGRSDTADRGEASTAFHEVLADRQGGLADGPSSAPSLHTLQMLADGRTPEGERLDVTSQLVGWLRPEFRARSVVSRGSPSFVEFGFSAAALDEVAAAGSAGLTLGWWPELEVNGAPSAGTAHGDVLDLPGEWSGGGRRYARFPLLDLLGDAVALDAVTVRPRITFVLSRADGAASPEGVPPPGPPGGVLPDGSMLPPAPSPAAGGTRWVWQGPAQTLFLYPNYPADYPLAVADERIDALMRAVCTPTEITCARAFGGADSRQLQLTLLFRDDRERPVSGAFEAELLLPGSGKVGARATLVLPAAAAGGPRDSTSIGLPFALTGPPSEEEQGLLLALRGGPGATVRLVLRGSRDVALQEPDLDAYWNGTVDAAVPVRPAAEQP